MNKQISRMNKIFTSLVFLSTSKTDGSNESSGPLIRLESVGIFVSECSSVYDVKSHYLQKLTILSWAQPCWIIVRHKHFQQRKYEIRKGAGAIKITARI